MTAVVDTRPRARASTRPSSADGCDVVSSGVCVSRRRAGGRSASVAAGRRGDGRHRTGPAIERCRHHLGRDRAAADLDGEHRARRRERRRRRSRARSPSRASATCVPLVTMPTCAPSTTTGYPAARCPGRASRGRRGGAARPSACSWSSADAPDEILAVELHPAEARRERRRLVVELVAVERQRRLEAQACRARRGRPARCPRRWPAAISAVHEVGARAVRRRRARSRPRPCSRCARRAPECRRPRRVRSESSCRRVERERRERAEDACGRRTLQRDQRRLGAAVDDVASPACSWIHARSFAMLLGVDAEEEPLAVDAIERHVVDDAAVLAAEHRVLRVAVGERPHVVGGEPLAGRGRVRPAHLDLAHVAHVEEPGSGADGAVLLEDAAVRHRHLPAAELDELGAERAVLLVERRPCERCSWRRLAHAATRAPCAARGDGVGEQHRDRHRSDAARHRRDPRGALAGARRTRRRRPACRSRSD